MYLPGVNQGKFYLMHRGDQLPVMPDLINYLKLIIAAIFPTGSFFFSVFVTFPVLLLCQNSDNLKKRHPSNAIAGHHAVFSLWPCYPNAKQVH